MKQIFFSLSVLILIASAAHTTSAGPLLQSTDTHKTDISKPVTAVSTCPAGCKGEKGDQGPAGPAGPTGPMGPASCQGAGCLQEIVYYKSTELDGQCGDLLNGVRKDDCIITQYLMKDIPWPQCDALDLRIAAQGLQVTPKNVYCTTTLGQEYLDYQSYISLLACHIKLISVCVKTGL